MTTQDLDQLIARLRSPEAVARVGRVIHDTWHLPTRSVNDVATAAIEAIIREMQG
jgi:hypothetical protein